MKKSLTIRFLDRVEKVGNRLPDPITLFFLFSVGILVLSWLLSQWGVAAAHPDGRMIDVKNLLSVAGLQRILSEAVNNFIQFPPLATVLVTMLGIGVAERTGLMSAALKRLVTAVPPSLLTATLVFAGVMSSMASDAGYVVLTPLGAVLFASVGRHPIAGLAATFAGVSGGYSANLVLTTLDPLLSGLTTSAAQLVQPDYVVQPDANYFFMIASTFLIMGVGTWVNAKIVEPRLGQWNPPEGLNLAAEDSGRLSKKERQGLWIAGGVFFFLVASVLLLLLPENGFFRKDGEAKVFYDSFVLIIMVIFLAAGLAYGLVTRSIKSDKDVASMMSDSMATMGGYLVLAFMAAQFVAYFRWSDLGLVMAIKGAGFLQGVGFEGLPLIISFIFVAGFVNLFIGSASAKWAIMAPVFVPMFMLMGYSPELTQVAYRIGDSCTNIITPLLPYFPIIIAFAQKYDKRAGLGTLLSAMVPYSIVFLFVWSLFLAAWMTLGLPLGPNVSSFMP
jgi:aminobenzoyl-glutamate transport protein